MRVGEVMTFFELEDCRTKLYQWDVNQKIIILDETVTEVQFENKNFLRSISQPVYEMDGNRYCDIPRPLLEQPDDITLYAYVKSAESGYAKVSRVVEIVERKRPNNYYKQFLTVSP